MKHGSPLGLADQSGEPLLALDQRLFAQVVAVMLDQVEAYSTASRPRRLLRSAKSGIPSSQQRTSTKFVDA